MIIKNAVLASSLNETTRSKENISIVCVTRDNKSFCINLASTQTDRDDNQLPNSVFLTEKPLDNYKIICRIASDEVFSSDMFLTRARVIANSLEDKLKCFALLKELSKCM